MTTQQTLKSLFNYDPETGIFTWRYTRGGRVAGTIAGGPDSCGRLQMRFQGKKTSCHRLAWVYVFGEWPVAELDHINGICSDNRIANLRQSNRSQNMCNIGARSHSKTGVKGVSWDSDCKKYRAQIMHLGKKYNLGRYDSVEQAQQAYTEAAARMHGEFARSA
ncbi:HNH endonuclease [Pseudomonas sp. NIBR-H-19]|uniref:HNH endonuclease n=1 Tax=Pseudomonas sp. NIBR-H-19 TaxID=2901380 RepID=UPI001E44AAEC|nr:HNH endonuclease [Pseudomonas sp. NIBR-H-19]UHC81675.1 HNH endonuclease [Pseudomonas sp. NIBR-H-19]